MPDPGAVLTRWRRVGSILPATIRERVYEPALTDCWSRWVAERRGEARAAFAYHAAGTLLHCLPFAAAALFVEQGRLTRFSRYSLRFALALVTLLMAVRVMASTLGLYR